MQSLVDEKTTFAFLLIATTGFLRLVFISTIVTETTHQPNLQTASQTGWGSAGIKIQEFEKDKTLQNSSDRAVRHPRTCIV